MISSYIPVDFNKIEKAKPDSSSYVITELKKDIDSWTYQTKEFTNPNKNVSEGTDFDFKIIKGVVEDKPTYDITNRFGVFINKRALNVNIDDPDKDGSNAINITTKWDQRFPETIKLSYPGTISTSSTSFKIDRFPNENNYDFKIWKNNYNSPEVLESFIHQPDTIRNISPNDYFYDLLSFISINSSLSYEEWLSRPSFSLKSLLGKNISNNKVLYQLYKINDPNVQSLSTNFDEYIPWCFDQNGEKIEQHKVALITSFNKKEIYLLLELRKEDIIYPDDINNKDHSILKEIKNIIFWRSGISDPSIETKTRSFDQKLLVRDIKNSNRKEVSHISNYFRESIIDTDVIVSFQQDRLEDEHIKDPENIKDNDNKYYDSEGNTDQNFEEIDYLDKVPRYFSGNKLTKDSLVELKIKNSTSEKRTNLFNNQIKNMFNIFVNGRLKDLSDIEIITSGDKTYLKTGDDNQVYLEIFINPFSSPNLFFYLKEDGDNYKKKYDEITTSTLQKTLYDSGLLWKLDGKEQVIVFDNGGYLGKETSGDLVIVHGINFLNGENIDVLELGALNIRESKSFREIRYDGKNTNRIVYDPMYFETEYIPDKDNDNKDILIDDDKIEIEDLWIFDNTHNDIKIETNEPYLKYANNKIQVIETVDPNIELVDNNYVKEFTDAIKEESIFSAILASDKAGNNEIDYVKTHYEEISIVNNNILNMFLYSGDNSKNWVSLSSNNSLTINKDFAIIKYTPINGDNEFPLIEFNMTYKFPKEDGTAKDDNKVKTKVKPVSIGNDLYYVLNRTADDFKNLYSFKFDKNVKYIII